MSLSLAEEFEFSSVWMVEDWINIAESSRILLTFLKHVLPKRYYKKYFKDNSSIGWDEKTYATENLWLVSPSRLTWCRAVKVSGKAPEPMSLKFSKFHHVTLEGDRNSFHRGLKYTHTHIYIYIYAHVCRYTLGGSRGQRQEAVCGEAVHLDPDRGGGHRDWGFWKPHR